MERLSDVHQPLRSAPARAAEETPEAVRQSPLPGPFRWLPGVFFLLVLALGAASALLLPETWRWPREGSLVRGEQAAGYERTFNGALPFRDAAIWVWGVLEYTLFGEGREGVVVGSHDWLFTAEEMTFYEAAEAETTRKLAFIERARDELAERGVTLVVAPIPDKSRVYAEFVGRPLPRYTKERYETFRAELAARTIIAPDLLTPLLSAKIDEQVYLRTDTHWTPAGAEVAAETLARALTDADVPGLFETDYETETTGQTTHRGDLLSFLPLGPFGDRLGPPPDRLETRQTRSATTAAGGGLFGAQTVPVTLIGTSYSADERWNFAGALQRAFGADVLNLATEGRGPLPPMRDYLASAELRDTPPTLVVWEVPERYLPAPEAP